MALSSYALVSLPELRAYVSAGGDVANPALEAAINQATTLIESMLGRNLVSRGAITEYHTVWDSQSTLALGDWPIVSVTSVHEDPVRAYGASTLLTVNDYIISKPEGKLIRVIPAGSALAWMWGFRAIRVVYTAGFNDLNSSITNAVAIPEDIRQKCLFMAASIYKEQDRQRWGVSQVSDASGNLTRYLGYLSPNMEAELKTYRRVEWGRTWERDA